MIVFDSRIAWNGWELRGSSRGHRVALEPDGTTPSAFTEVKTGDQVALVATYGWNLADGTPVRADYFVLGTVPGIGAVTWAWPSGAIGAPLRAEIVGVLLRDPEAP